MLSLFISTILSAEPISFHVSLNGNDCNVGASDSPFLTLDRAKLAVRASRPLAISGTTVWGQGKNDSALTFDGQSTSLTVDSFTLPGTGTVSFWMKAGLQTPGEHHLVRISDANPFRYFIISYDNDLLRLRVHDGTIGASEKSIGIPIPQEWTHIAAVWTQSTLKLYLDGQLKKEATSIPVPSAFIKKSLYIGSVNGNANFFRGSLDDLRIFGIALDAAQVSLLASSSIPGNIPQNACTGLLAEFKFNETTGGVTSNSAFPKLIPGSGGAEILIHEGAYKLTQTIQLTALDSGTKEDPIVYRGVSAEKVRIQGGIEISPSSLSALSSSDPNNARINSTARQFIRSAHLPTLGITNFGDLQCRGVAASLCDPTNRPLEVFQEGSALIPARYPNGSFFTIGTTPDGESGKRVTVGNTCIKDVSILVSNGSDDSCDPNRPAQWGSEPDLWVHGYFYWDWSANHSPVSYNNSTKTFLIEDTGSYGVRAPQWFYPYNILKELDQPGEWYLDRSTQRIYVWPKSYSTSLGISILPSVMTLTNVSNVSFQNLTFEFARGTEVELRQSSNVNFNSCIFRHAGSNAMDITGGTDNTVFGSEFYDIGEKGIYISAGDRTTLSPSRNLIMNNLFHHFARVMRTYRGGVDISGGVGTRVAYNEFRDAPHTGVFYSGNDHLIEYNHFENLAYESNDAGAVYGGRDWTSRGNKINNNHFKNILGFQQKGTGGKYFDDMLSGNSFDGNLLENVHQGAGIGGGRDNSVSNNVFFNTKQSVFIDERGTRAQASDVSNPNSIIRQRLEEVPYSSSIWMSRFPEVSAIAALVHSSNPEVVASAGRAIGNKIEKNISVDGTFLTIGQGLGCGVRGGSIGSPIELILHCPHLGSPNPIRTGEKIRVFGVEGLTSSNGIWNAVYPYPDSYRVRLSGSTGNAPYKSYGQEKGACRGSFSNSDYTDGGCILTDYVSIKDNFISGDPGFVDAERGDFRLKSDSPARALGIAELPFSKMGRIPASRMIDVPSHSTVYERESLLISLSSPFVIDEGIVASFKVQGLPSGAVFDPSSHTIKWNPPLGSKGIYKDIEVMLLSSRFNFNQIIEIEVLPSRLVDAPSNLRISQ